MEVERKVDVKQRNLADTFRFQRASQFPRENASTLHVVGCTRHEACKRPLSRV